MQTVDKVSELLNEKEIREIIKRKAEERNCKIAAYIYMSEIIALAKEHYNSKIDYFESWFYTNPFNSYSEMCVELAFESMKDKLVKVDKSSAEYQLYFELENHRDPEYNFENLNDYYDEIFKEDDRITEIIDMLSTEKIFEHSTGSEEDPHTLHEMILKLYRTIPKSSKDLISKLKKCILILKNHCDAEGMKSILKSANKNDVNVLIDFSEESEETFLCRTEYFIKRLEFMTSYIERVFKETDTDMKTIGEKYWIRSTGSDTHCKGQHALFLVNKKTGNKEKVYKPHDLSADDAVVGKNGMFNNVNDLFKIQNNLQETQIGNEDAFVTMKIDAEKHTEEFVTKTEKMTQDEAKKYFFAQVC